MIKRSPTIWVGKESYMYLNRISREQRGCKQLSQEVENKMWNRQLTKAKIGKADKEKNLVRLDNDSMGGGDGTYSGKWWSWSISTIKEMLDEAKLPYSDGEELVEEYTPVYF